MKFKIGTRVIVRPYDGWEYKGEIVSDAECFQLVNSQEEICYYSVMDIDSELYLGYLPKVCKVNVVKIRIDKEWDRDQKINSIINE